MNASLDPHRLSFELEPGHPVHIRHAAPAKGGCVHSAWKLDTNQGHIFLKLGAQEVLPQFEAEARGLKALAATNTVRVPNVLGIGINGDQAFLALEHLPLVPLDAKSAMRLGEQLARLHHTTTENFGAEADNFIGSTPQHNHPHANWPRFFGQQRLLPQLHLAREKGLERQWVDMGEQLVDRLGGLFTHLSIQPSLVHGDLWSGNVGALPDGKPVIFDPAVYYGHREVDLAMAELFGGFPPSFYVAYRQAWHLDEGYEQRKTLYNLYHMLNHFNLFGASYRGQCQRMIGSLTAEMR